MVQVDSNTHLRSKESSSGLPGHKRRFETASKPRNSLLALQWVQTRSPKDLNQPQLRQVARTRSRFVASREATLSPFPHDTNCSPHRQSLSDVRYIFAGPTQTDPQRNALQKSFPSASVRPAPTRRVGDRVARTHLRRTSNRKTSGNTLCIGNISTNASTTG